MYITRKFINIFKINKTTKNASSIKKVKTHKKRSDLGVKYKISVPSMCVPCMYVCMYVCVCVCVCVYVCMYVCVYVCVCMFVCMYGWMDGWMDGWI